MVAQERCRPERWGLPGYRCLIMAPKTGAAPRLWFVNNDGGAVRVETGRCVVRSQPVRRVAAPYGSFLAPFLGIGTISGPLVRETSGFGPGSSASCEGVAGLGLVVPSRLVSKDRTIAQRTYSTGVLPRARASASNVGTRSSGMRIQNGAEVERAIPPGYTRTHPPVYHSARFPHPDPHNINQPTTRLQPHNNTLTRSHAADATNLRAGSAAAAARSCSNARRAPWVSPRQSWPRRVRPVRAL